MSEFALQVTIVEEAQTEALAALIAKRLLPSDLLILTGGLGAGKTFFTRALAYALGLDPDEPVTSPTFTLVHEYPTEPELLHSDLYRLSEPEEVEDLGLDVRRQQGAVLVVEWGRPYVAELGGHALFVDLQLEPRRATLTAQPGRASELLCAVVDSLKEQSGGEAALEYSILGEAKDGFE